MAYIGAEPVPGQNREVDDISSGFNGNATSFTLQVSSLNVSPESANNILINLGGVLQNPGTDYTVAASTLTFTTAPAAGLSFFGLILGAGINTATVADDTIGASKLIDTAVTAGSYTTADITVDAQGRITAAANGTISGAEIADQAVTNAKVNNSAAIAGSKISPDFGSQNIVTTGEIKSNTLFESASGNDLRLNAGSANRDIFFQVNDSTLTTVQGSTGNVGIGTSSPSDKLHVRGASAAFTAFILDNATNSSSPYKITYGDQGQVNHLVVANRELTFGTNNAERVRIDSSGNVGIGTTSPSRRLDLNIGGDQTWFEINKSRAANEAMLQLVHSAGNRAAAIRYANADNGWKVGIDGTESFTFANGATNTGDGTERMRITSTGNVGINVTTPANVLEVLNTSTTIHPASFRMTGAHQYASSIMDNDGANGSGGGTFISCRMSNSIKGDIVFNGSVMVYGGQSDYRLKENVVSINDGIAKIKQLNPLRYNFIDNPSQTCEGFFAHEAQAVCPQSATGTKDEIATEDLDSAIKKGDPVYQQMDYSKLVPILTAGLKEAIAKIETLETEVAALKAA